MQLTTILLWVGDILFLAAVLCGMLGFCRLLFYVAKMYKQMKSLGSYYTISATDVTAIAGRHAPTVRLSIRDEPGIWCTVITVLLALQFPPSILRNYLVRIGTEHPFEAMELVYGLLTVGMLCLPLLFVIRHSYFAVSDDGIELKRLLWGHTRIRWEDVVEASIVGSPPLAAEITVRKPSGRTTTHSLHNGFRNPADFETIVYRILGYSTRDTDQETATNEDG